MRDGDMVCACFNVHGNCWYFSWNWANGPWVSYPLNTSYILSCLRILATIMGWFLKRHSRLCRLPVFRGG